MSKPRQEVYDPREVNVLHIFCRCAQQRWLFGKQSDGRDGQYRRSWIENLIAGMARIFAIDIGFHVEMSNHFHLIIRNRPDIVATWDDDKVIYNWVQVSHLTKNKDGVVIIPTEEQLAKEKAKCAKKPGRIDELRKRLADPSDFMKCHNENLSRRVNRDENTSGHLFEARFDAVPLLGEGAVLAAAIYVELNQIRAGEVETIEQSRFTSMHHRLQQFLHEVSGTDEEIAAKDLAQLINAWAQAAQTNQAGDTATVADTITVAITNAGTGADSNVEHDANTCADTIAAASPGASATTGLVDNGLDTDVDTSAKPGGGTPWPQKLAAARRAPAAAGWLGPLQLDEGLHADVSRGNTSSDPARASDKGWLSISFLEFISLADWTAKQQRTDKPGATPDHLSTVLVRLGLRAEYFLELVQNFRKMFKTAVGSPQQMATRAAARGKRCQDATAAKLAFAG